MSLGTSTLGTTTLGTEGEVPSVDLNVPVSSESLLLTELPVTITKDRNVPARAESLILTTYSATIEVPVVLDELLADVSIVKAEATNVAITKAALYEVRL